MRELPDFTDYYAGGYSNAMYGKGLMPFCIGQSHKLIEKEFTDKVCFPKVCEIGCGLGWHLKYVRHKFNEYVMADTDEKVIATLERKDLPLGVSAQKIKEDKPLPFADGTFDRLIAVHVLEHIHHPELALKEWSRVVKKGGIISVLLPCDPGVAWRFGRLLSARKRGQQNGLDDYDVFMALEHVNPINVLYAFLKYGFSRRKEEWWPLRVPLLDVNLFYAVHVVNED